MGPLKTLFAKRCPSLTTLERKVTFAMMCHQLETLLGHEVPCASDSCMFKRFFLNVELKTPRDGLRVKREKNI